MRNLTQLHIIDRKDWRAWLEKEHMVSKGVWLLFDKKHTGRPVLPYNHAVEEALCFGWIDSILRRIDDDQYARKFTLRNNDSKWSKLNKARAQKMITQKQMTKSGLAKINAAKKSGAWDAEAGSVAALSPLPQMPEALVNALDENAKAAAYFNSLAPSHRRNYIGWIASAKKDETRQKRIREAIGMLVKKMPLGLK